MRTQLRRASEKSGTPNSEIFQEIYQILIRTQVKELKRSKALQVEDTGNADHINHDYEEIVILVAEVNGKSKSDAEKTASNLMKILEKSGDADSSRAAATESKSIKSSRKAEEVKKPDTPVIPEDFRCPISLELMRDPVIVSTGQVYS